MDMGPLATTRLGISYLDLRSSDSLYCRELQGFISSERTMVVQSEEKKFEIICMSMTYRTLLHFFPQNVQASPVFLRYTFHLKLQIMKSLN